MVDILSLLASVVANAKTVHQTYIRLFCDELALMFDLQMMFLLGDVKFNIYHTQYIFLHNTCSLTIHFIIIIISMQYIDNIYLFTKDIHI